MTSTWAATRPTTARCRRTRSSIIQRGVCAFVDKGAAAAGGRRGRHHRHQPRRRAAQRAARLPGLRAVVLRHPHGRRGARRPRPPSKAPTGRRRRWPPAPSITNAQYLGSYGVHRRAARASATAPRSPTSAPRREHHLDRRSAWVQGQHSSPAPRWRRRTSLASRRSSASAIRASGPSRSRRSSSGPPSRRRCRRSTRASRVRGWSSRGARSTAVGLRPGDGPDAEPLVRLRPDPDRRLPRVQVVHDLQLERVAHHVQASTRGCITLPGSRAASG